MSQRIDRFSAGPWTAKELTAARAQLREEAEVLRSEIERGPGRVVPGRA